jgi:F-box/leucine-rich repeat protein 2/20
VIKYYLPLAQALVRGHVARVQYAKLLLTIREFHSAVAIQAAWRGWLKRSEYFAFKKREARKRLLAKKATAIQRIWRGYMGRRVVRQLRDELRDAILAEAKLRARQEVKARVIQQHWRGVMGRKRAAQAQIERDADRALQRQKHQSSLRIQRVYRGHLGRRRAQNRRDEVAHFLLCWRSARHIQRMYRGHRGRLECARMRELRRRELEHKSAIKIQAAWRGLRGRHLAALARGVELFRKTQIFYAVTLQRAYRGFKARIRVTELKRVKQLDEVANAAAITIQRVYRGHKGRENREVEAQLIQFEHKARPLVQHLDELFRDRADWEQQLASLNDRIKQLEHEVEETTIELGIVSRSTSHWYDSSRINQTPQRFLTKYLQVRLREHLERHQKLLEEAKLKATNLTIVLRMCDKDIRQTRRELIPLTTGVIVKTKRERTERLRNAVRRRAAAIVKIQSVFRGYRLRKAIGDAYSQTWVTCTDEASTTVYYHNPSTGQSW